jgi:hypothetical protein
LAWFLLVPGTAEAGAPIQPGRWNLNFTSSLPEYAGWLELTQAGGEHQLRLVGRAGAARQISRFEAGPAGLRFETNDWFGRHEKLTYQLEFTGGRISGTALRESGDLIRVEGAPAPALDRPPPECWDRPEPLFNGADLDGWAPKMPDRSHWLARNGILANPVKGTNLISAAKFEDFALHLEFRIPRGGNSGVFLRGRYEIQLEDEEQAASRQQELNHGAVYGFLAPVRSPSRLPGEWQSLDVELVGRTVAVRINGVLLIDKQSIPGPTGGTLDSSEDQPGPLMLQGDHGPVEFRNVTIRRAIGACCRQ